MDTLRRVNQHEAERRVAHFKATVKSRGVKMTPQRIAIFREVASSLEHPDAIAIYSAICERMPTISLDTVYRTLWILSDLGLISTLGTHLKSVRFDANMADHNHFVCVKCGMTRDFENEEGHAPRWPDALNSIGQVITARLEVRGNCWDCESHEETATDYKSTNLQKGRKGQDNV